MTIRKSMAPLTLSYDRYSPRPGLFVLYYANTVDVI